MTKRKAATTKAATTAKAAQAARDRRPASSSPEWTDCPATSPAELSPGHAWPCQVKMPDHTSHYNSNVGTWPA